MKQHHNFRALKDSTLDPAENRPRPPHHRVPGGGRIGMVASGNPDVLKEAKGDERKKGGRVKRAHGGHIDGHKSKHRMDRPGRKRGGRANRDIGGGIGGSPYGGGSSPYGGGMPYIGGAGGYIPTVTIGLGRGAPQPIAPAPQPAGPFDAVAHSGGQDRPGSGPPKGLVLTAASTMARWRGTGTADHHSNAVNPVALPPGRARLAT